MGFYCSLPLDNLGLNIRSFRYVSWPCNGRPIQEIEWAIEGDFDTYLRRTKLEGRRFRSFALNGSDASNLLCTWRLWRLTASSNSSSDTHTHEEFHQSRWVRSSEWASTRVCIEIGRPTKPLCKSHTHKIFISWQTWQISLAPRVVYTGLRGAFRSSKSSKWRNPYSSVPTGHQANHTRHLVDWERANFSTNSPISLSHS